MTCRAVVSEYLRAGLRCLRVRPAGVDRFRPCVQVRPVTADLLRRRHGEVEPLQTVLVPLLTEIAWEAMNPVGGIYTVLRSKLPTMMERWGRRYCVIGPYMAENAAVEGSG